MRHRPDHSAQPDRGTQFARDGAPRPPWSSEASIRENCTSCGACIRACPEAILRAGPAGTPTIEFALGACSFCQACAEACTDASPGPVFDLTTPPWHLRAQIAPNCLLASGVSCRSCTDACDTGALRFDLRAGAMGRVSIVAEACTGCGACLSPCPTGAISLSESILIPEPV